MAAAQSIDLFKRDERKIARGPNLNWCRAKKQFSSSRVDKTKRAKSSSKEFAFLWMKIFEIETDHERDCHAKRGVPQKALRGENVKHLNIMWTREFRTKPAITILLWFMLSLFGYYRTRNAPYGKEKLLSLVLRACRLKLIEGRTQSIPLSDSHFSAFTTYLDTKTFLRLLRLYLRDKSEHMKWPTKGKRALTLSYGLSNLWRSMVIN